ncbi:MAG TPA: ATP-binding protein [Opitutaceae bacterium]|jgi:signal transduction histidine kinase
MDGPLALIVEGDANTIRRLVQNMLFNALKYTERGGVTVSGGEEKKSCWVVVKDSGPGFLVEPDGPIAEGLREPI